MKVGDLVTLSSVGRKIKQNHAILHGDVGLIVKIVDTDYYPFRVVWTKTVLSGGQKMCNRRELKYAK